VPDGLQGEGAPILAVRGLTKTYATGVAALRDIDLAIRPGEIFALLGPNGAGKTTLINIICGIVTPTDGTVVADGHDVVREFRAARACIGLVPQELHTASAGAFSARRGTTPTARRCCATWRCGRSATRAS